MRRIIGLLAILAVLAATAVLGITTLLNEARVTELAKSQIARLGGDGYETDLTSASLQLFQNGIAGIQIDGITIRNAQTNEPLLERGKASFSISLASLLFGKIELTGLALADAQLYLAAGVGQSATLFHAISGPDGLVDPALAAQWLEDAASRVSSRLFANPDLIIGAQNTTMILGRGDRASRILIEKLTAAKANSNEFTFEALLSNSNWTTRLTGAVGQTATGATTGTPYRVLLEPIPFRRDFKPQLPDLRPRYCEGMAGFAVASSNGLASVDANIVKASCTFGELGDYAINATINGRLKRQSGVFEIGRGVVEVNTSLFNFDGAIAPARNTPLPEKAGESARYRYELVFAPSKIGSLDADEGPLAFEGKIAGTYAPAENRLALDEFTADAGGSIVRGAASLLFTGVTPALYLALTSDQIPVQDFKRVWPRFAVPNPRRIVMERVKSGNIRNLRLEVQLPPGKIGSKTPLDRGQLSGSGDVEGAEFTTFGELPPVTNAKGRVFFDGKSVNIQLKSGTARLLSGKQAKVEKSSFFIADTHIKPVQAELKVALTGAADAIAEIAVRQPVNAFNGEEIIPEDLSGAASVTASLQLVLVRPGQKAPVPDYQVDVQLSDFAISKAVNGQKISNASGTIKANNNTVDVRLDAELGGIPAKIIISQPRGAPEKRTQDVALTLTDSVRDKLAPGLKPFLSGPVTARIKGSGTAANVELDLTKAVLRIVPFNWEKGAGIGAKANFTMVQDGSTISIADLQITGRGLNGKGKAVITNSSLQSADLTNVRLNPGDNFSLSLKKAGQSFSATLGGAQLDARALLKQMLPGGQPRKTLSFEAINAGGKIGRLLGFNDETIVNAVIGYTSAKTTALSLSGDFESGGSIDVSRTNDANGRLIVQTGNAGAALRFVDLYKRMTGGVMATDFKVSGQGGLAGPVSITNFTVVGEPRLAQLVNEQAAGSTSLAAATEAELAGDRAKFELAQGEIVLDSGTIRLKNGIVRGANVGATAEGIVLSAQGQMDLRGTFMPARGLNRIVGAIPLLGLFLGSGNKAGLIGITYQLVGNAKSPKVLVNPISMIAPGVFRQIFE